ncbi:MAG: hypothetical protein ACFFHD_05730 [Promethearchaeota archaeon]
MEKENKDRILNFIREIKDRNSKMEEYLSSLSLLSREDMLKEICRNIIEENKILQEIVGSKEKILSGEVTEKVHTIEERIDTIISNIQENETKKIIYLREFIDTFQEISDNDRNVIIQSLKDEENINQLKEKMLSLSNIFKLT